MVVALLIPMKQPGRGFGTYSMKFFSEEILGGKVVSRRRRKRMHRSD